MEKTYIVSHIKNQAVLFDVMLTYWDSDGKQTITFPPGHLEPTLGIPLPECTSADAYANNQYIMFQVVNRENNEQAWVKVFHANGVRYFTTGSRPEYEEKLLFPSKGGIMSYLINPPIIAPMDHNKVGIWIVGDIDIMPGTP